MINFAQGEFLLIGAWVAGMIAIAVFGVLSGALATAVSEWIGRLF